MPQYTNSELLTDVNGRPIPQYYDTKDAEFKPLTGKTVILAEGVEKTVAPNQYLQVTDQWTDGFSFITVGAQTSDLTNASFSLFHQSGSSVGKFWGLGVEFARFYEVRGEWERFDSPAHRERIFVRNTGTTTKTFTFDIYGIV